MNITIQILLCAIAHVESNCNPIANNPQEDAVGILQIRPIFIDDCNRIMGRAVWEPNDRYDVVECFMMTEIYFKHYAEVYKDRTGKEASAEVLVRMFNGGPRGYEKKSTEEYWKKVEAVIIKFFHVEDKPDMEIGVTI